ncbi:MAG: STAS domain-containing protein [Ruminococcaceae bacterium]|nr:STAS domain-containing protein [Oscillospiraceae bacterium]
MQLELSREAGVLTAHLIGELDHHAAAPIRQQIDTAVLSSRCHRLVLDFRRLTFMDSSGIGLIMGRYRLMSGQNGTLRVENATPQVEKMMKLAGLSRLPIWNERKEPQ